MRPVAYHSHHQRMGTRPTEQHLPSPSGRGGGQDRLRTLACPSQPHLPPHSVMHSNTRPSTQFWRMKGIQTSVGEPLATEK